MQRHAGFRKGTAVALGLTLILLLLAGIPARATTPLSAQSLDSLRRDIDSLVTALSIPGAAVALVSRDSVIWMGTFGRANLETGEAVTEQTRFCIGSCTKTFIGLSFLKLLAEGVIDLQTPVRAIAPEITIDNPWSATHPVRIIHLLEHTSGFDDSHPNWFYFEGPILSLSDALAAKAHLRRVRWPPGTRFAYSSAGYTLAGYVLEKVTGQSYDEYLKQALLEPMGMTTSTLGSSEEDRRLLAVGYDQHNEPFPTWYDYDEPAGAMNTSISEMARFVRCLLNRGVIDGQEIISAERFDQIGKPTTTLAAQAGLTYGYSFGIGTRYRGGARWHAHSGAVPGFVSEYACNLEHGLGYVVLQNSFDVWFNDDVFTRVRRFAESRVDSAASPPPASVSVRQLGTYCGYYEPRSPRLQLAAFGEILAGGLTVGLDGDMLYSQGFMAATRLLIPVSEQLFRRTREPEATAVFTQTSDGRMVFATRDSYYERTAAWKPVVYRTLVFGAVLAMMSTVVYALFWVPLHVYRIWTGRGRRVPYLPMRVVPLLAVLALILGVAVMTVDRQTILQLGQKTPANILFAAFTWIFAGLSVLSLWTTYKGCSQPVSGIARAYAALVSAACFGMTLYLGYWGLIGLRLWAY